MQVRCYRCNTTMSLKPDEIAFVVEALEEEGGKHYGARCIRCRHTNRVSLERLKQEASRLGLVIPKPTPKKPGTEKAEVKKIKPTKVQKKTAEPVTKAAEARKKVATPKAAAAKVTSAPAKPKKKSSEKAKKTSSTSAKKASTIKKKPASTAAKKSSSAKKKAAGTGKKAPSPRK